ncbi:EEv maturation protein [White-tailed deer poxvirus]|nr:EEv maturation protein [White-tailed deer poxvirus]
MFKQIFKSLSENNSDDENNHIITALEEYKFSIVLARTKCGKGIIVYSSNLSTVKSMIDLSTLEIAGITKYVEPCPPPMSPISKLFIDESESDYYYSPATSRSPLIDILIKRASSEKEIENNIKNLDITGNVTVSEINYWMCCNGLAKYRFMNYRDDKIKETSYTLIDEMIITYIGNHYIWVKDKLSYTRPELDILPYDIESISQKNMWSKIYPYNRHFLKIFSIYVNAIITPTGPSIYMISVYPGKCFIDFDSKKLISEFLKWVRETMNNVSTIAMVGYLSSVFDFSLLRASWPEDSGWTFIGHNNIVSKDGLKIVLLDVANFSCGMTLKEYCNHWEKVTITPPKDLITKHEAKLKIKLIERCALKTVTTLYNSINNHFTALNVLIQPWFMLSFNKLEDMIITKVLHMSASNVGGNMYYPTGNDSINFIYQSIRSKYVKTVNTSQCLKTYSIYRLKSLLKLIEFCKYPIGVPKYVKEGSCDKLYIALCEVTVKRDVRIPIIFLDDVTEPSYTFYTPLTCVDIELARMIGGYKIRELGALQWDSSVHISDYLFDTINNVGKLSIEDTVDNLIDKIMNVSELFPHKEEDYFPNYLLPFAAFSASYCRMKLHSIIKRVDSHFLGEYVFRHNYKEVWINDSFKKDQLFLSEMVKVN